MTNIKDPVIEDTHGYGYQKKFRVALPQFLAVSVKNLVLLTYGMTLGFPTILIPAVKEPTESEILKLGNSEISWIGSINLIIVPVGCALSGIVTSPMGRRRAMQMVNVPFFVAWLIFHYSSTTTHLYGALFLTGLAGGLLEAPVLTYVAEITQPHLRGALTATSSMCTIIGVFTQFLFGLMMYWRTVALVNIFFVVITVVALFFIPESPYWLVSKKRHDDARRSLQWLRGWTTPEDVEDELRDIQALYKQKKADSGQEETFMEKVSHYLDKSFLVPFFLVSYGFFVGHFSGMTTLQMLEAPIDKYYATLILGILQIIGCGTCVLLVHYTGKRFLTFFSTGSAGICCLVVAGYEGYIKTYNNVDNGSNYSNMSNETYGITDSTNLQNPYSWIPTILLMLLALLTHTGIRLLPWILISEVFSARTRSGAAGLASAVGYIFGFLTNKTYISMLDTLSLWGTYGFYGIVCLTGCAVFYFILPETEGKKLQDIENHFAGVKKLTNEVYRSKKKITIELSHVSESQGITNSAFEVNRTNIRY